MKDNNIEQIGFSLHKVTTEQFAMFDENMAKESPTKLSSQVKFGVDEKSQSLIIVPSFKFEQEKLPFLIIETACYFRIEPKVWSKLLNAASETQISFPKDFMRHLTLISIGTTRGVLHAKTENTMYNQFLLPTINVHDLVTEDVKIDF